MQTDPMAAFADLSTKGLQAIAGILSGKAVTRNESKASAMGRVERLVKAEADQATTLGNLPGLLRARGFDDDAGKLAAKAPPAPAPEVVEPAPDAKASRLPKEGTKARMILDLMMRPGGVLNRQICDAVGYRCSFAIDGRRFAERCGLEFRQEREGREMRFWLRRPEPA